MAWEERRAPVAEERLRILPQVILALELALWVATTALRDNVSLAVVIHGVRVSALDVLCVALALAAVARIFRDGVQNLARALALALLLLLAIHVARGFVAYGVQPAANDARTWFYFTAALIYAATVPGGWGRNAWKIIVGAGLLLAAVAIPYFLIEGLSSANDVVIRNDQAVRASPILAVGAILILQAVILAPTIRWPPRRGFLYAAVGGGLVVLLLQHRTVWVAALLVAVVALFWWYRKRSGTRRALAVGGGAAVIILAAVAALALADVGPIGDSARSATDSNSTFHWRVTGWRDLLESHDSASNFVTGQPAGGSFSRTIDGVTVNVSAHNELVESYIRFGILGAILLIALAWLVWSRREEIAAGVELTSETVALLLLSQVAFSLAYGLDLAQGAVAGMLLSGAAGAAGRTRSTVDLPGRPAHAEVGSEDAELAGVPRQPA